MTVATARDVDTLRESCRIAATIREELRAMLRPGLATRELDAHAARRIKEMGGRSAFKGYRGYPATICVSVNEQVVHGIPGDRRIEDGDLVSVDIGVQFGGFYSDTAICEPVGRTDPEGRRLVEVTREALEAGIAQARPGGRVSDISHAIQSHVERAGFSIVREFVGHGIGRSMHEEPQIPNYGEPGRGQPLVAGQALAIEPMVNEGDAGVRVLEDGWTAVTQDGRRSAHYEHTVLVTAGGAQVLTIPGGSRNG